MFLFIGLIKNNHYKSINISDTFVKVTEITFEVNRYAIFPVISSIELNINHIMENSNKKFVKPLQGILEKNKDAQKGYSEAAKIAEDKNLQAFFDKKSIQRAEFMEELRVEMAANFDEIDADGSCVGHLHRKWMEMKAFFSENNDKLMLEESIRGDKAAIEEYEEVLKEVDMPERIASLIRRQHSHIQSDLKRIEQLKDIEEN